MDRYLSGEQIDPKVLIEDLEKAVARGSFYPVLTVSAARGIGLAELLEVMTQAFPSPEEHPMPAVTTLDGSPVEGLSCDPAGPLLAEVVKTTSDPYVGRVSLVRMFSGTLHVDAAVHVSGHGRVEQGHADHDTDERVGALTCPLGKQQRPVTEAVAGDICAVAKLGTAETGDTLSSKEQPLLMEPWMMPEPLLPVAVSAKSKADEDKMAQAMARLVAEDPTLRRENNAETHQQVLWCMGEAHADVLLDRLTSRYGVAVETSELRVPLRETIGGKANGLGRNVKQSGGHGEYAICHIEVEPLPGNDGFEFVDKVVGGVVPRQFIPSVEKGVRSQMEQGVVAGYPMTGVRVTLYDGKAHSVDSSDMAFQKAGRAALRDAVEKAQSALLEPVDEVAILIPDDYVGAVMSDLSSRRGRVLGTEPVPVGRTLVRAEVPELEITRYTIDLRSVSHGTGSFTRSYLRHEPLPAHLAAKIAEGVKEGYGTSYYRKTITRSAGHGASDRRGWPAADAAEDHPAAGGAVSLIMRIIGRASLPPLTGLLARPGQLAGSGWAALRVRHVNGWRERLPLVVELGPAVSRREQTVATTRVGQRLAGLADPGPDDLLLWLVLDPAVAADQDGAPKRPVRLAVTRPLRFQTWSSRPPWTSTSSRPGGCRGPWPPGPP